MTLAARLALIGGGGGGKRLPYDAEVEYLESTGTQWIDTGIVRSADVGFRVTGMMREIPSNDYPVMMGAQKSNWSAYYTIYGEQKNIGGMVVVADNTRGIWSCLTDEIMTGSINYLNNGKMLASPVHSSSPYQSGVALFANMPLSMDVGMFCALTELGPETLSKSRIYGAQISKGAEIVRDFIPVRFTNELGNTEGAMYDRVSGALFRNAGTGAFLYGADKIANMNGGGV